MVQEAILDHPDFTSALAEDALLSGFGQKQLDVILAIAISNQKAAGYTVGEVGAGSGAFTKQALKTFITVPQSALLGYTAMDTDGTSDITKSIQHGALSYKVQTSSSSCFPQPSLSFSASRHSPNLDLPSS